MKRGTALLILLAAAGCKPAAAPVSNVVQPEDLESAAIERGMVRDPRNTEITGLYARDTDRVCIVGDDSGYRIGAYVDYGDRITCSGSGTVTRYGSRLHVELGQGVGCSFDAHMNGDKVIFPGNVPDGCARLCARRASFAGLAAARMSDSEAEARAMRDRSGRLLCRAID